VVFYSTLAVVDVFLMVKTAKAGPQAPRSEPTVRLAAAE
jgi:cytochrome d ubiquinol oxidase subunit I